MLHVTIDLRRTWLGAIAIIAGLLLPAVSLAQNTTPAVLSKAGEWPGHARGMPRAICVTNGLAYVAAYPGNLLVFDIRIPAQPTCIGSCETLGAYNNIAVSGNCAYVAGESTGFRIIDVSNPAKPRRIGGDDVLGRSHGFAVSGKYVFRGNESHGASLWIMDVSNPTNCLHVVDFKVPGRVSDILVQGNMVFVAAGQTLSVIDIKKMGQISIIGRCDIPQSAISVTMAGNIAYVMDGYGQLQSIDVSNPKKPVLLGQCVMPHNLSGGRAGRVVISGQYAYASDRGPIVDVSNPTNLVCMGSYARNRLVHDVAVAENHAYVAGLYGLEVIDISNPTNSAVIARHETQGHAVDVAVAGNFAYLADGQEGMKIIDVSNPDHCQYRGGWDIPQKFEADRDDCIRHIVMEDKHAYLVDASKGIEIIDVSTPGKPSRAGGHAGKHPLGLAVKDSYAYFLDGELPPNRGRLEVSLSILDVGNPGKCKLASSIRCQAENIVVKDGYAYATGFDGGLQIFDIKNPSRPAKVGQYMTNGGARKSAIMGGCAYLADGTNGLVVVDVSHPEKPTPLGKFKTGGRADAVAVSGKHAFMADGPLGLQVFDVADPKQPVHAGRFDTVGEAIGVTTAGAYVYVAAGFNGLQIYKISPSDSVK